MTWEVLYDGLSKNDPKVVWEYRGEMNLRLAMMGNAMSSSDPSYHMFRKHPNAPDTEWETVFDNWYMDPSAVKGWFNENYPTFPVPADLDEKYEGLKAKPRPMLPV